ncbi:hypothetical protein V6N12_051781 [Hibiscus sabdariffa]|uniref:Uncharacterized protein n=1 Tax=Hibiscus sabdariffa TaxID=183260 RepID=A0ABR2GGC7_9ROSI
MSLAYNQSIFFIAVINTSAGIFASPVTGSGFVGLKTNVPKLVPTMDSVSWSKRCVSNGSRTHCMKTLNPIINKKLIPCLEFDVVGGVHWESSRIPGYYDGRY